MPVEQRSKGAVAQAVTAGVGQRRDVPVMSAAGVGAVFTALVVAASPIRFAYENLGLHVALETAQGCVAALLAFLSMQRLRTSGAQRDLAMTASFASFAVANLALTALPIAAVGNQPEGALTWAAVLCRLGGAGGLCAAAFLRGGVDATRQTTRRLQFGAAATLVIVGVASLLVARWIPVVIDPELAPSTSSRPRVGHPAILSVHLVAMALYGTAAFGFRRQAQAVRDDVVPWLGAGAVLAGIARLHFVLFPSLYSNWVYTGDLLRLGAYVCFLVAAARQIDSYRQELLRVGVLEDRRRLARDLHDGLAQELSFIRSQTAGGSSLDPAMVDHIAKAADRALHESRRVIEALADSEQWALEAAVRDAAEQVAHRRGAKVLVEVNNVPDVSAAQRRELAWVVREAVTNAVHHGGSTLVSVTLRGEPGRLHLEIVDDGQGFTPRAGGTGFGLRSMRERIEGLGGTLTITSAPGAGTTVAASIPVPSGRQRRRSRSSSAATRSITSS